MDVVSSAEEDTIIVYILRCHEPLVHHGYCGTTLRGGICISYFGIHFPFETIKRN